MHSRETGISDPWTMIEVQYGLYPIHSDPRRNNVCVPILKPEGRRTVLRNLSAVQRMQQPLRSIPYLRRNSNPKSQKQGLSMPMETTVPTETVTKVIEVVEQMDYTEYLVKLVNSNELILDAVHVLSGFALFAIVVCLCYFCYKFFRIFF